MDAQEITTRLPPRREDEPASLRQDIVDEILDHLQCGLRRELLVQGGDEASAKKRVLSHFGDPKEIARKLWFQAMWSKIMSQRIVVGSAVFSMTVCAALVGMICWMMQQQQQANAALLEHLVKLIPQRAEPLPQYGPRKSHLKLKVTFDTENGPAAKGWLVTVTKHPELGQQPGANGGMLTFLTDQSGLADCGLTEPGRFGVTVNTPWNERTQVTFTIPIDRDHVEHIVAPGKMPEMTKVVFRVDDLPDELESNSLGLIMRLRPQGSRVVADRLWQPTGPWAKVSMPIVLLSKQHELRILSEPEGSSHVPQFNDNWIIPLDDVVKHGQWEPSREWSLPAGEYSAQFGLTNLGDSSDPNWQFLDNRGRQNSGVWLLRKATVFTAESGKLNEWTIRLPEHVSMCLRDPSKISEACDPGSIGGMGGGGMGGMGGGGGGFF